MSGSGRNCSLPVLLTLLCACTRPTATAPAGSVSGLGAGPLLAPAAVGEPFLWRQRVTARWGERIESFDAVLQLHDDELTLMGLGPMGRPGFIVTLRESGVTFENRSGRGLPFDPEHIMADVQKAFYPWIPSAPLGFSGTRVGEHGILRVTETHADGRLRTRAFQRSDAIDRGELRVTYDDWDSSLRAPGRAVLDNRWFGYELTIVTVEQQSLPAQATGSAEATR